MEIICKEFKSLIPLERYEEVRQTSMNFFSKAPIFSKQSHNACKAYVVFELTCDFLNISLNSNSKAFVRKKSCVNQKNYNQVYFALKNEYKNDYLHLASKYLYSPDNQDKSSTTDLNLITKLVFEYCNALNISPSNCRIVSDYIVHIILANHEIFSMIYIDGNFSIRLGALVFSVLREAELISSIEIFLEKLAICPDPRMFKLFLNEFQGNQKFLLLLESWKKHFKNLRNSACFFEYKNPKEWNVYYNFLSNRIGL